MGFAITRIGWAAAVHCADCVQQLGIWGVAKFHELSFCGIIGEDFAGFDLVHPAVQAKGTLRQSGGHGW